ncbi:hypothetical protein PENANT_c002G08382 [Penicillium antarcticum]|uniref:ER-bound oxygenase mpaB/mpaB'/Rubber oxygenase catalytic domain-containing protein n=1 Tax=Penicillium antarcticum TaxID=416450 RepID=A0A1V6QK04_9EURO|nr:hypothetical protein PENANT_c002G08382 [Penicillium antarcticum]
MNFIMDDTSMVSSGSLLSEAVGALASPHKLLTSMLCLLIAWPVVASSIRNRRARNLVENYPYLNRASMSQMTDEHAFQIQKQVAQLEFPFMFIKSLQFALFRTYGIPTISALLTKTTQFSNPETSLKRYTDTSALVQEMVGNDPTSQRAFLGLARTRYLHRGYRSSGQILEEDMLYTLGLFALQPIRFIDRFEWRTLNEMERCAIGTFWKSAGDALDISYDPLPSGKSESGFRDGIQWLEEMEEWCEEYEARCMLPDVKNREVADQTTAVLVYMLPTFMHPVGLQFVSFMMDERLRKAMLYDPPTPFWSTVFSILLTTRKLFLRHLMPPRPNFLRYQSFTEEPDEDERFFLTKWEAAPYYVKPTLWNRWGPTAWLTWALGRPVPGDEGDKYSPTGYSISDLGPKGLEGKGKKELEDFLAQMKDYRTGKCPFH